MWDGGWGNAECGMRRAECGVRNAECGMRSGAQVVVLQGVGSDGARRGLVNRSYGSHGTHGTYFLGRGARGCVGCVMGRGCADVENYF